MRRFSSGLTRHKQNGTWYLISKTWYAKYISNCQTTWYFNRIFTLISMHFVKFWVFTLISIRFINLRINTSVSIYTTSILKSFCLRISWLLYPNYHIRNGHIRKLLLMPVLSIIVCYERNEKLFTRRIFFNILNFLQLQILMKYHLVIYISWI